MRRIVIGVLVVGLMSVLGGRNPNITEILYNNVSEYCEDYFVGETQDYYIELFDGEREEPYYLDGVSEEKQGYTLLVVTPKNSINNMEELEYCVELNGDTVEGGLESSPCDDTMSSEVNMEISANDVIFVYIKMQSSTQVSKMQCVSVDFVKNWNGVLCDVYQNSMQDIGILMDAHKSVECYVQIINKSMQTDLYYWCVTLIFDNGDRYTWIVDTKTNEILAKNL